MHYFVPLSHLKVAIVVFVKSSLVQKRLLGSSTSGSGPAV